MQEIIKQGSYNLIKIDSDLFKANVIIPLDVYSKNVDQYILSKKFKVKGFKDAPIEILRKEYGSEANQKVQSMIYDQFYNFIKDQYDIALVFPKYFFKEDALHIYFLVSFYDSLKKQDILIKRPDIKITEQCIDNAICNYLYQKGTVIKAVSHANKYNLVNIAILKSQEYIKDVFFDFILGSMEFMPHLEMLIQDKPLGIHKIKLNNQRNVLLDIISSYQVKPANVESMFNKEITCLEQLKDYIKKDLENSIIQLESQSILQQFFRQFSPGQLPWLEVFTNTVKEFEGSKFSFDIEKLSKFAIEETEKKLFLHRYSIDKKNKILDTKFTNAINVILSISKVEKTVYKSVEEFALS